MTNVPVYPNSTSWVGCAIEATPGVAVAAPTFWIPVMAPKISRGIIELQDTANRGQMNTTWQQTQGTREEVFEFTCMAHVDVLPHLFRSVLGSPDTVTGSASPYTHVLSLLNNAAPDQPPSYTWFDYDGFVVRQLQGGQTDQITLTWRADGLVQVKVRILAFTQAILGTVPAAVIGQVAPTTAWDCTSTVNGLVTPTVTKGSLTLKRNVVSISTLGAQVRYDLFAGPLDVRGQMSFLNRNDAELNIYTNNLAGPTTLAFANIAALPFGFTLDMAVCKAEFGSQERGADGLITATLDLLPLPNSTDATAGGVSPIKATFRSPQAAAY